MIAMRQVARLAGDRRGDLVIAERQFEGQARALCEPACRPSMSIEPAAGSSQRFSSNLADAAVFRAHLKPRALAQRTRRGR